MVRRLQDIHVHSVLFRKGRLSTSDDWRQQLPVFSSFQPLFLDMLPKCHLFVPIVVFFFILCFWSELC